MNEALISEVMARRFLLGQCGELDRERIESLFVTDAIAKETILLAEQELIDEYLDGSLIGQEREQFVRQYQATAELRHRIRIAESLRRRGLTFVTLVRASTITYSGYRSSDPFDDLYCVLARSLE